MPRGGSRLGAGGQFKWNYGKTKTIRVPESLADRVLEYARKLDADFVEEEPVFLKLEIERESDSNLTIEHVTQSKIINLSGITIRACNGKSAIYLEDLANAGYEILPERLGKMFKVMLNKRFGK
jgi:hypothetical protein